MPSLGEAYIEVHADTGPFDRELAASIEKSLIAAEATMRSRGRDAGNAFGEGVGRAVDDHMDRIGDDMSDSLTDAARNAGRRAANAIGDELSDVDFNLASNINFDLDVPDFNDSQMRDRENEARSWGQRLAAAFGAGANSAGNFLNTLVNGISRLNNISTVLNPGVLLLLTGLIGGLFMGLVHLLNPLTALMSAIPAAISVLALEGLVLAAAFDGLGKSIENIFTAETFADAMKIADKFEGPVGRFMEGLVYFSQLWRDIIAVVKPAFFAPFDNSLKLLAQLLSQPEILAGVRNLAYAMGLFANSLIKTFASKPFIGLVKELLPTVTRIVDKLSGPFLTLLNGVFDAIKASLPFMETLAGKLGDMFTQFGQWLSKISTNGQLDAFFDDMVYTLGILGDIVMEVVKIFGILMETLRSTGVGDNFLQSILMVLEGLTDFFASPVGQKAIVSMTEAAMGAIVVLGALVIAAMFMWTWFTESIDVAAQFLSDIWGFLMEIGDAFRRFPTIFGEAFASIVRSLGMAWINLRIGLEAGWQKFSARFNEIRNSVRNAFNNAPTILYNAGKNLITGFINGIKDSVPGLKSTLNWITGLIPDNKGPEERDKKLLVNAGFQVMQGFRRGLAMGAEGVMGDLRSITDMIGVNANANSFNFAPGAITQNFNGAQPSSSTAYNLGSQVGAGISNTVNQQNMRAAVRAV